MERRWITTKEAAETLMLRPQTLALWRMKGLGPKYHRIGHGRRARVLYAIEDVEVWLESRRFSSMTEETVAASSSGA